MSTIEEFSQAARDAAANVGPSVVRIGRGGGRGCGVVVGDGLVATNAHNLRGNEATVTFADGRTATSTVAGADLDGDLAVLRVDTAGITPVPWRDEPVAAGDVVFAVSESAVGGSRVSFGLVSATGRSFRGPRGRRVAGSIEHTAPLVRGSSGSPIVDSAGRLVGLNTNRLGEGFYLALPADSALRARVDDLAAGRAPSAVRLGLGLAPAHVARRLRASVGLPERDGLLVRVVEPGTPAAHAGIKVGDLLVSADGVELHTIDELFEAIERVTGGGLSLLVVRGTDEIEVRVTFDASGDEQGEA